MKSNRLLAGWFGLILVSGTGPAFAQIQTSIPFTGVITSQEDTALAGDSQPHALFLPPAGHYQGKSILPEGNAQILVPGTRGLSVNGQTAAFGNYPCIDGTQRLLLHEDSLIVVSKSITRTRDGNMLIPGYYYATDGLYYNMPYLVKCDPSGNILWSRKYLSTGIFPSQWFSAVRILELQNGDLLMTGQIGIPGTDNRRDLAIWRLNPDGSLIWGSSYENRTWTDPITGSAEITGLTEDPEGNIYLAGNLRFFELSRYAFVLKMDGKGRILWDRAFAAGGVLGYGILSLRDKLLFIGGEGPLPVAGGQADPLWCIRMDPHTGDTIDSRAWYPDFGPQNYARSFAYANTCISLLNNGSISVSGTANSDLLGVVTRSQDTILHSIVAQFTQDFDFLGGIMLASRHLSNYYNTVVTQHPEGRISFTRFSESGYPYNEDVLYGHILPDLSIKERIFHQEGRSSSFVSNFLFYAPAEDVIVQSYHNNTSTLGGLELVRLHDNDTSNLCNGTDTSLTFVLPYAMTEGGLILDSVLRATFQPTRHNFISVQQPHLVESTGCQRAGVNWFENPKVVLDKDSILCDGGTRLLSLTDNYAQYTWNDGSTNPSLSVNRTGTYWVTVRDQNGCKGSDTVRISTVGPLPRDFLPPDTSFCQQDKLTIRPLKDYPEYLWSDFSTEPSLTIDRPGWYRLQVTDSNHCVGTDSILVTEKSCFDDLVVPNAFTPNGDGRNDLFRPVPLENLARFRFSIFNRWGQKVFETQTLLQGWDGTMNGKPAAGGVYVWYCRYQPQGQPEKLKKGTVVLIR